jgi:hypothetical protein
MMRNSIEIRGYPRQVWLAGLGAAVVTRDWAQSEASNMFRTLVKEGTAVESRTVRIVGDRLEDSFAMANTLWKQARSTVQATVRQAADTAVALVQNNLPKALPKVTLPAMLGTSRKAKAPASKRSATAKRASPKRGAKAVKRVTRKARTATKK